MLKEKLDQFFDYLATEKKFTRNTIAAYKNDINQFRDFIIAQSGEDSSTQRLSLTARLISDYRQKLIEKGYRVATVARKIAAIRCLVKFMLRSDKLPEDMDRNLTVRRVVRDVPKTLSISEIRRLLTEPAKESSAEAVRDKAMLQLLYATGLQASELMSLNVTDIDLERNIVHCSGRSARKRDIAIDPSVAKIIKEYLDIARPELAKETEEALFVNIRGERLTRQGFWQILKQYGNRVGIGDKVTPRVLRHSFAVSRLRGGNDLPTLQKMLGHAYLTSTKVYEKIQ